MNLAERQSNLLVKKISALCEVVARVRVLRPFAIEAWVVLPGHLHAVWTLPADDADFSLRWTLIKRGFSACVPSGERRTVSRAGKGERGIWQRRFWEHLIRDENDLAAHVDYVHFNPVKHGFVQDACDWPFFIFAPSHEAWGVSAGMGRRSCAGKFGGWRASVMVGEVVVRRA